MKSSNDDSGAATARQSPEFRETLALPADAEAAKLAREFVDQHRGQLSPDLIADAQLLVSEIVTNAVRYGRPDITLAIRVAPPGLGIAVTDVGEDLPSLPPELPGPERPSGRGLLIVNALASAWGVTAKNPPPGKAVWFDLKPGRHPSLGD